MRILFAVSAVFLAVFSAVQYNDPDWLFWGLTYGVCAVFCGVAAIRPEVFQSGRARWLLTVALVLCAVGVVWFWPKTEGFWHMNVWWETETAREGMGIMFACLALAAVWFATRSAR